MTTITVKSKKTAREITFEKDFGSSLEEAVARFTEDVVFSAFLTKSAAHVTSVVRNILDKDENSIEVAEAAAEKYVPGVVLRRGGSASRQKAFEVIADRVNSGEMSIEELTAMIAERKAVEAEAVEVAGETVAEPAPTPLPKKRKR